MDETPVEYYNRHTQRIERERIYGEKWLRWAYGSPLGRACLWAVVKRPFFSAWYGWLMSRPSSAKKIAPFVEKYGIDASEFEKPLESYASFNDFFSRRLKAGARPPAQGEDTAVFGADGRHSLLLDAGRTTQFFIKGEQFDLARLLDSQTLAERYEGGTVVLSRLCPVDYHRFHFPCAGEAAAPVACKGALYSVSPIALRRHIGYLWRNRRVRTQLRTARFGAVQIVEIGATNVGTIRQTFAPDTPVEKGGEKGFFAFGGSAVATVFEKGAFSPADDLRAQTAAGRELYARCGTPMGFAARP